MTSTLFNQAIRGAIGKTLHSVTELHGGAAVLEFGDGTRLHVCGSEDYDDAEPHAQWAPEWSDEWRAAIERSARVVDLTKKLNFEHSADAATMISFLVCNLDHVDGFDQDETGFDTACDYLFPTGDSTEIDVAIPTAWHTTAVRILESFAERADQTAVEHEKMIQDGEDPPCSPDGCRIAAVACRAAAALLGDKS